MKWLIHYDRKFRRWYVCSVDPNAVDDTLDEHADAFDAPTFAEARDWWKANA